jgi:hypothetical protein
MAGFCGALQWNSANLVNRNRMRAKFSAFAGMPSKMPYWSTDGLLKRWLPFWLD